MRYHLRLANRDRNMALNNVGKFETQIAEKIDSFEGNMKISIAINEMKIV